MVMTKKNENKTPIKHENKSTIASLESLHEQFLVRKVYSLQTKITKLEKDIKTKEAENLALKKQLEHYNTQKHIAVQAELNSQIQLLQNHYRLLQDELRTEKAITTQLHAEYQIIMANCLLSAKQARICSYGQKKAVLTEDKSIQCKILSKKKLKSNWIRKSFFPKLLLMCAFYFLILFFIFVQVFIFGNNLAWEMKFENEPLFV